MNASQRYLLACNDLWLLHKRSASVPPTEAYDEAKLLLEAEYEAEVIMERHLQRDWKFITDAPEVPENQEVKEKE